jgi:hypothetical protein
MSTELDLEEGKRLLAEASAAPWDWLDSGGEPEGDELQDGRGEMIATGFRDDYGLTTDGRLAAWLRNAAPDLIAAAEREAKLRAALRELLRVAFRGDDFLTQNNIPMAATPGVRRALRKARAALGDS